MPASIRQQPLMVEDCSVSRWFSVACSISLFLSALFPRLLFRLLLAFPCRVLLLLTCLLGTGFANSFQNDDLLRFEANLYLFININRLEPDQT